MAQRTLDQSKVHHSWIYVIQGQTLAEAHDSVVFHNPFKVQSYLRQSDNGFCEL